MQRAQNQKGFSALLHATDSSLLADPVLIDDTSINNKDTENNSNDSNNNNNSNANDNDDV